MEDLVFGWRTALMLVMISQMAALSVLLLMRSVEPLADRILVGLIAMIAGLLTEQMIGFAGFYDAFRWLSFAPLVNLLLFGPLIAGYVYALTVEKPDPRWLWLLLPGAVNFLYEFYWFLQPLSEKTAWTAAVHRDYIRPVRKLLEISGAVAGLVSAFWLLACYRYWLSRSSSIRAEYDLRGLGIVLIAASVAAAAPTTVAILNLIIGPLNFFQAFPSHIVLGVSIQVLALTALLQPRTPFPKMPRMGLTVEPPDSTEHAPDWSAIGQELAQDIQSQGWHREPRFSLAEAAERLRMPERTLSTALNAGLGESFNSLINRLRLEDVKARLENGDDDLLSIAFACGFNSKASFNRVFRERLGETPTQYRKRVRS